MKPNVNSTEPAEETPPLEAADPLPDLSDDTLLTRTEAALYLRIQPQTLAVWACHRKFIAFVKVGRLVRYPLKELRAYRKARTVNVSPL